MPTPRLDSAAHASPMPQGRAPATHGMPFVLTSASIGAGIGAGVVGGIAAALGAGALAGSAYQTLGMRHDARRFAPAAKLVDIGGHRLYLAATGMGSPTVVMESGLGHISAIWSLVAPAVADLTRVCVYDRASYGWSEPGPAPRTSEQVVHELRALLAAARIAPPYLLVGHSFGGLCMLLYALRHPADVAGLVLLDPLAPELARRSASELRWFVQTNRIRYRVLAAATHVGLFRLYVQLRGPEAATGFMRRLPAEVRAGAVAELLRHTYTAARAEATSLYLSVAAVRAAMRRLETPLVVLSHGVPDLFAGRMSPREVEQAERMWQRAQEELAAVSLRGQQTKVVGAGHKIHVDQPAVVIAAIRETVMRTRAPDGGQ